MKTTKKKVNTTRPKSLTDVEIRSARSLAGHAMGVSVNTRQRLVTASFTPAQPIALEAATELMVELGALDSVSFICVTAGQEIPDSLSITWHSTVKRRDLADLVSDVEIATQDVTRIATKHDIDLTVMDVSEISCLAGQCWGDDATTFPPQLDVSDSEGRSIVIGTRHVAAFEVIVDETLTADAVLSVLDTAATNSCLSLIYRPSVSGRFGRFSAAAVLDCGSASELQALTHYLFDQVVTVQRTRIRRCFHRHEDFVLLGAGLGLAPWLLLEKGK